MVLITGGVKTGKSMLSVHLVKKLYSKAIFKYNICRFFKFKKFKNLEKPLIYSNIPLKFNYVPLTKELINRTERFSYGSIIYICEASLVADSMSFKDQDLNERMLLLNKLIAHETKGGYIVYDTQSIDDNHYSVRRCLSNYIHITKMLKLPFFCILTYQNMSYSDHGVAAQSIDKSDTKKSLIPLKTVWVSKKIWKLYDRYCYSIFTDNCPVNTRLVKGKKLKNLKANKIISFKKYNSLGGEFFEENSFKKD